MKKKKNNNKYERAILIVNKIQDIRSKNNKNWMDLLKIAFKKDPKVAAQILSRITSSDKKISKLTEALHKQNK